MGLIIGIGIVVGVICGFLSAGIAQRKGMSVGGFYLLGFFLGVIGLAIAALAQTSHAARTPAAWYPDPWGQAELRWYDGARWTGYTHAPHPLIS